ncbi:MAG: hypothetical protein D6723_09015 [Acidobacteria bacterium]|nr:MAG: hypothetical protein D6723_09015 [Acidobacteriota bacterium]
MAPAVFSLLGLAGVGTARLIAAKLTPVFLVLAILLLGRAHYLIYVKKHGTPASRLIVWIATIATAGLWIWRL